MRRSAVRADGAEGFVRSVTVTAERPYMSAMHPCPDLHIRRYRPADARALFAVFHSAVHVTARHDYRADQLHAWAPKDMDPVAWAEHMERIKPFVAQIGQMPVGYADVQPNGCIDHFFVSGLHARRGIGRALMQAIETEAMRLGIGELWSHVSRTAQPFFEQAGFAVVEQRSPVRRGVVIPNALMRRPMVASTPGDRCTARGGDP